MKAIIEGIQEVSFTNTSGVAVVGKNIFVSFEDENVVGRRTEKFFVKDNIPFTAKVQDVVNISFNHKAKIESITKTN